jgi:hypothetical protein
MPTCMYTYVFILSCAYVLTSLFSAILDRYADAAKGGGEMVDEMYNHHTLSEALVEAEEIYKAGARRREIFLKRQARRNVPSSIA